MFLYMIDNNVWSTRKVEALMESYDRTGVLPKNNPFFMRKINKKKADLVWEYTNEELISLARCKKNILRFAESCKVMTKKGVTNIKLRPYQVVVLRKITENKFFIYLASRQIGKSIIIGIFIAWTVSFFSDKSCLLGSENLLKAKDLKMKIDDMIHNLPMYMQNGIVYTSTQRNIYDNGSKIISEPTTENFGVSGSYNVVYMDEFALLEDDMQDKIIKHIIPTLDSFGDEARFIISTTPRGKNNKFYRLFTDAMAGKNKFGWYVTKWYEVEDRDEQWKKDQIAIVGDEGFMQEYDLSFQADSKLLFNSDEQRKLDSVIEDYISLTSEALEILENYIIPNRHDKIYNITKKGDYSLPDGMEDYSISKMFGMDEEEEEDYADLILIRKDLDISMLSDASRQFSISIDLASGAGQDYSVANFFEVVPMSDIQISAEIDAVDESDFFCLEQVAVIRSNTLDVEDFAKFLYYFLVNHCEPKNIKLVIEINHEGGLFLKVLFGMGGDDNGLDHSEMVVEFPHNMDFENSNTYKTGIKNSSIVKTKGVKNIKRLYGRNRIILSEKNTVYESQGFGKNKKGSYEGTTKNDDLIITVVNITHYFQSDYFFEQIEEVLKNVNIETYDLISSKVGDMSSNEEDYSDYDAFSESFADSDEYYD